MTAVTAVTATVGMRDQRPGEIMGVGSDIVSSHQNPGHLLYIYIYIYLGLHYPFIYRG